MALQHDPGSAAARVGRWAAVVLAAGAASASVLAVGGAAGASSSGTKVTAVKTSGGKVLSDGNTVYTLKPSSTKCTAACLVVWPAVVLPSGVKHASAGSGVTESKLGTVTVPGVGVQVTYGGKRLYRFSGDSAPGQVNGNVTDEWGKWTDVVVSKSAKSGSGSSSNTGSSSNSGSSNAGSGGASF
jgi:predicted lipoprotein with Yx(FWY)xxD motif